MKSSGITHLGIVAGVGQNGSITVKLARNQCDGCKLGELCGISAEDTVEIKEPEELFYVGEQVEVEEMENLEVKAIFICLVIPCLLLLTVVIFFTHFIQAVYGCMIGILALAAYYGIYYLLLGDKKDKKVLFKVKKI